MHNIIFSDNTKDDFDLPYYPMTRSNNKKVPVKKVPLNLSLDPHPPTKQSVDHSTFSVSNHVKIPRQKEVPQPPAKKGFMLDDPTLPYHQTWIFRICIVLAIIFFTIMVLSLSYINY